MKPIELPLVSFETAKLLKEKGVPILEPLMGWHTKFYEPKTGSIRGYGMTGRKPYTELLYAPTKALLQQHLREACNIHICIAPKITPRNTVVYYEFKGGVPQFDWDKCHKSYDDALDAALKNALNKLDETF